MKVLISVISLQEACEVCQGGGDILDVKNVEEGALGANFPWVIRDVSKEVAESGLAVSATLGDLSYKPGTASLAALGALSAGARYIKAGLKDIAGYRQGVDTMGAIVRSCRAFGAGITVVAAAYADYRRFGGIDPLTLVRVAAESGADVAMLDTFVKDGATLFDAMTLDELSTFVSSARQRALGVALAGSIGFQHATWLAGLAPDIVGVRAAVCRGRNRRGRLDAAKVQEFGEVLRMQDLATRRLVR